MALITTVTVGRLLARNELLNTAKLNAMVKGIVINISGSVGTADLQNGAVTALKTSADAFWYALATSAGATYTAVFAPVVTAYVDGMWLSFKTDAACKEAPKFDAGAGALPLLKWGGQAVGAGELPVNSIVTCRYNATLVVGGCWEILSPVPGDPARNDFGTASAMKGGERGLVPAPLAGQQTFYLKAGVGWTDPTADIAAIVAAQLNAATTVPLFLTTQH